MLKMINVLDQHLVQNFAHSLTSHSNQFDELLNQSILNASQTELQHVISNFLIDNNAVEVAHALDISSERIQAIQSGAALNHENLTDTAKVVALCLAIETNSLAQVDIAESLQDYPI